MNGGPTNAFDTTTAAFEGANSMLFLLLGGLSCFQRLRAIVGGPDGAVPRPAESPAARGAPRGTEGRKMAGVAPTIATGGAPAILPDHVTLAVLGLLATGRRLTDLCAEAATPEGSVPARAPSPVARRARRKTSLRTMLR